MLRPLAGLLLALAACQSPDAPPEAEEASPLAGTEWRLATVDGDSVTGGRLVTVGFSDDPWEMIEPGWRSLGGYDGCNDFGVGYRLDGDRFRAGGGILSNAMACGPPGGHLSDSLHTRLSAARTLRLDGRRLVLADSLGAEWLAFVPRPVHAVDSTALVTGRWRLDPAASAGTRAGGGPSESYGVAFAPDGTYAGSEGCHRFGGRYRRTGDRLWVESMDVDDRACAPGERTWSGPEGLSTGELEADDAHLVITTRTGDRAAFVRP